jgi:hypothetical protein
MGRSSTTASKPPALPIDYANVVAQVRREKNIDVEGKAYFDQNVLPHNTYKRKKLEKI